MLINLKNIYVNRSFKRWISILQKVMDPTDSKNQTESQQSITEGSACIKTSGKVFYNPVQEFNRDLRLVLDA